MELQEIIDIFHYFASEKENYERVCRQLDAYDSGNFWSHVKAKLPKHQMLVDTNYINYIKQNQVNSIYSGGYIADINPRSAEDEDLARNINAFLEFVYDDVELNYFQLLAGDRAALLNVGAIMIEWDKQNKKIRPKFIDTSCLYLDPATRVYQEGSALFIAEIISRRDLIRTFPEYKDKLKKKALTSASSSYYGGAYIDSKTPTDKDDIVYILNAFVKNEKGGIDQYVIANEDTILANKENIKPDMFPVAVLYGLPPIKDAYGFNVAKLCLRNCLALNLLDSIGVTHVYAQQRRATIMRKDIGITPDYLSQNINNPDATIPVNGDPTKAVHQLDLPDLPSFLVEYRAKLEESIFLISGIDPVYTGRQTNSITTTGGVERMQQRSSLTDATRIAMLEHFVKNLTKMIYLFYVEFGDDYKVFNKAKHPALKEIYRVNFKDIREKHIEFDFSMNASPYLPKNRVRYAEAATQIMEMQGQYQMNPPLITPEEWLKYQDFPQKDLMLQRMEKQRVQDDTQEITENVVNFSSLLQQGVTPDGAIQMLADEKAMMRENPKLGNVAAGSPQARQEGM